MATLNYLPEDSLEFKHFQKDEFYGPVLDNFEQYLSNLTDKLGSFLRYDVHEYYCYALRCLNLYDDYIDELPIDILTMDFAEKLKQLYQDPYFNRLDAAWNNMYSLSLGAFINYLNAFNDGRMQENAEVYSFDIPIKRYKKEMRLLKKFPINKAESLVAKRRADWKCESNPSHYTFLEGEHPYLEAHHLIPMEAQVDFEYSLDFADNIIALCPVCHQKMHHANKEERDRMVGYFFAHRQNLFEKHGIQISLPELKAYYDKYR